MLTDNILDLIGNTPLIRLRRIEKRCRLKRSVSLYAKAEWFNPSGSVKDRAALGMIMAARKSGELRPGGVIVEGTAGNTGIGLAMVGSALGHRTIIVMPENQSKEKIDTLRAFRAELRIIPKGA